MSWVSVAVSRSRRAVMTARICSWSRAGGGTLLALGSLLLVLDGEETSPMWAGRWSCAG